MNKYIEADKLLAEIERLEHENCMNGGEHFCMRRAICLGNLRNIITPLYHEQQEVELEKLVNEEFASHCRTTEHGLVATYNRAELYRLIKRMALVFNARKEE